jgi:transposase
MTKLEKNVIGIDVGSENLWADYLSTDGTQINKGVKNLKKDINIFLGKLSPQDYCLVVESTGSYSSRIVNYAIRSGFTVYVANPLSIKRFGEMHNFISKTDAQDAMMIRRYGEMMEMRPYVPKSIDIEFLEQELNLWEDLEQEKRRYASKRAALKFNANINPDTAKQYDRHIRSLEAEIAKVVGRVDKMEKADMKESLELLCSIKGIGTKTAMLLLTATNGFKNFENAKSMTKYFGLAPRLYQSGKKKMGLGKCRTSKNFIRSKLYICSWSAIRSNTQCRELYQRLLAKGKAKKLALIAVCAKLIKQAFGVIKNKIPYEKEYQNLTKNSCIAT